SFWLHRTRIQWIACPAPARSPDRIPVDPERRGYEGFQALGSLYLRWGPDPRAGGRGSGLRRRGDPRGGRPLGDGRGPYAHELRREPDSGGLLLRRVHALSRPPRP